MLQILEQDLSRPFGLEKGIGSGGNFPEYTRWALRLHHEASWPTLSWLSFIDGKGLDDAARFMPDGGCNLDHSTLAKMRLPGSGAGAKKARHRGMQLVTRLDEEGRRIAQAANVQVIPMSDWC